MVDLDQAFVDDFIDKSFGLPIAHENADCTPVTGTPYAEIFTVENDQEKLDFKDTDINTGFFRVILRYQAGSGAIPCKQKADTILDAYPLARRMTYSDPGSTTIEITRKNRSFGVPEPGWYKQVLTIYFKAYSRR